MSQDLEKTPRERAMRLWGRIQTLTQVSAGVERFGQPTEDWRAFMTWLQDLQGEVLVEWEMVKSALEADD